MPLGDVVAEGSGTDAVAGDDGEAEEVVPAGQLVVNAISPARGPAASGSDVLCAEWDTIVVEVRADGGETTSTICVVEYHCASERIDDIVSGHIEGEPDGAYAEYVLSLIHI